MKTIESPMGVAIELAKKAYKKGEVPVGAVVVQNGKIVGKGQNRREKSHNALWHAEMVAINRACKKTKDWRLEGAVLFVTLEPCMMCLGACLNARISKVVFGAYDPKGKNQKTQTISTLNHTMEIEGGKEEQQCKELLQSFFRKHRNKK